MSAVKVSVIMPVYNSELYLKESVDSILAQTFTDFELICIDDCSTDNSLSILKTFADQRIKIIDQKKNGGVALARNAGISVSVGEYIAFLDADDIAYPTRLQKQVTFLDQHLEAAVVFSKVRLVDVYGNPNGKWLDDELHVTPTQIASRIAIANCVSQPAAMLRKNAIEDKPYSTAYKDSEDWGLWLQLLSEGKSLHKLDEVLVDYRIRPNSETQRSNAQPLQKKIRFRETYLSLQNEKNIFTEVEKTVAVQLERDKSALLFETKFKKPLRTIKKVIKANPFFLLLAYFRLLLFLKKNSKHQLFFFFPFYHVGGAEKVHASIVNCFQDEGSLVFFTKKSENTGFLSSFASHTEYRDIWKLAWYPFFKTIAAQRIANHINKHSSPVVISSNSVFFYDMLPYLQPHVKCIDLIHAFVHPEEIGPEKWSLPHLEKINSRVFIGQKAIEDLRIQYKKHQKSEALLERVRLIRNYVTIPTSFHHAPIGSGVKLVYIGRSTPEKRVHLAAKIASSSKISGERISLCMIGDVKEGLSETEQQVCNFKGIVTNEEEVYDLLLESDILLLTSSREGFPMAIAEAMACGIIPISTAVGDIPNVIRHGENGFLLPIANEELIVSEATKIIQILCSDPELTIRIRQQARKDAERMFGKLTFVQQWRELVLGK